MEIVYVAWIKDKCLILDFEYHVDVLVNVIIIFITRLQNLNAVAVHDSDTALTFNITNNDVCMIKMALTEVPRSIDFFVTADNLYYDEKERL